MSVLILMKMLKYKLYKLNHSEEHVTHFCLQLLVEGGGQFGQQNQGQGYV